MADFDSLLADILDQPDDDGPRLVFAEALQGAGDPRGEFIALQLATGQRIHGAKVKVPQGGTPDLDRRLRSVQLYNKHQAQWFGPVKVGLATVSVHRGFIDRCEADLGKFLDRAPALLSQTPLRQVQLVGAKPALWDRAADATWWGRLASVDLSQQRLTAGQLRMLCENEGFQGLQEISAWGNPVGDPGFLALAATPFRSLETCQFSTMNASWSAVAALIRAPWFARVRTARLFSNPDYSFRDLPVDPDGVEAIVEALCALPAGIEELTLPCPLDDRALERLGQAPILQSLTWFQATPSVLATAEGATALNARRTRAWRHLSVVRQGGLSGQSPSPEG